MENLPDTSYSLSLSGPIDPVTTARQRASSEVSASGSRCLKAQCQAQHDEARTASHL